MHLKLYLSVRGQQDPNTKVVRPIAGSEIKRALLSAWRFHDWHISESSLTAVGDDYLNEEKCALLDIKKTAVDSEDIQSLIDALSKIIWQTQCSYCPVRVSVTVKTENPLEIRKSSPEQFARMMGYEPTIIEQEADQEIRISS